MKKSPPLPDPSERLRREVEARTTFLMEANEKLKQEMTERERAEAVARESEARMRGLLDALPDTMLRIGRDGTIVDFRPGRQAIDLQVRENLLGRKLQDVFHDEWATLMTRNIDIAVRSGRVQAFEYTGRMPAAEGAARDYEARITSGGDATALVILRDVTSERRSARLAENLRQYYRAIFDFSPSAMLVISHKGLVVSANPAWRKLFGKYTQAVEESQGPLEGRVFVRAFPPDFLANSDIPQNLPTIMHAGKAEEFPVEWKDETGTRRQFQVFISEPIRETAEAGEKRAIVLIVEVTTQLALEAARSRAEDLSKTRRVMLSLLEDLDRTRADLAGANTRLRELDRLKSEFLSMVSHDLRTPIAAIKGAVENVLDELLGEINADQRESLEIVKRNAERLTRLIANLLDLSRMESGRLVIERRKTDAGGLLRACADGLRDLMASRKLSLAFDLPAAPVAVWCDADRIAQVLTNLIGNAIKFARSEIRITLRPSEDAREARMTVEDDGGGIPENELEKIFDRFYQIQSKQPRVGTGLGLAIVKGIVDAHGGSVWAENRPTEEGGGARFVLLLPVEPRTEGEAHAG